jgi:hypothetical protein
MSAGRSNGSHIDFLVTGDPVAARTTTEATLFEQKFRLTWQDDWNASAERGSEGGNFLLGGLVTYLKLGLHIMSIAEDQFIVRLEAESSGNYVGQSAWVGESMGKRHMDDEFETLRSVLESAFTAAGTLRSVTEG